MTIGAWTSFKRNWQHQAISQTATLSVLTGSFLILVIALILHQNFQRILTQWGEEVKVSIYLRDDVEGKDKQNVEKLLTDLDIFSRVRFLNKESALTEFKARMGQHIPWLLSDLEFDNPLPESFEAVISNGIDSGTKYDRLVGAVEEIRKMAAVDEVSYGQGWVENYASVLKVFSLTATVFVLTLLVGCLFVVGSSIRSSVSQRRDEIEILELCGATRQMIMRPFLFEGAVMGLLASFLALAISWVLFSWQSQMLAAELVFWSKQIHIEFLSVPKILLMVFTGIGIGMMGSFLWVRKVASGWSAAEAVES